MRVLVDATTVCDGAQGIGKSAPSERHVEALTDHRAEVEDARVQVDRA